MLKGLASRPSKFDWSVIGVETRAYRLPCSATLCSQPVAEVANNNNKDVTCGKSVGNFHSKPAHAHTCFDWYCIYLRYFFFKCACRQCPVCPNVYSRLRMFSCLPIPPTRVPLASECPFLHTSFQEDFRTLRSLFTLLRCHYNWRRSACTALDVVGDLYVSSKQNLTQSLQYSSLICIVGDSMYWRHPALMVPSEKVLPSYNEKVCERHLRILKHDVDKFSLKKYFLTEIIIISCTPRLLAPWKWMRWDDKYKCVERKKGWFFTLKASIILP